MKSQLLLLLIACFSAGDATVRNVTTSEELRLALTEAVAGDTILLVSGRAFFEGPFVATVSGAEGSPILITAGESRTALINSKNATALTLKGDHLIIDRLMLLVSDGVGVLVEGQKNVLRSLTVTGTNETVVIKGSDNKLEKGVFVSKLAAITDEGSRNELDSAIVTGVPAISLSAESCCGTIKSNTVNGNVIVSGNKFVVEDLVINGNLTVSGCENKFKEVMASTASTFTTECQNDHEDVVVGHGHHEDHHDQENGQEQEQKKKKKP